MEVFEKYVGCPICGHDMPLNLAKPKWFCTHKCRVAARSAIRERLHPNNYASHIIRKALSSYFDNVESMEPERMSDEQVFCVLWCRYVINSLEGYIRWNGQFLSVEQLIREYQDIYAGELSSIDARVANRICY